MAANGNSDQSDRARRLEEQLRANLKRRKEQSRARERAATGGEAASDPVPADDRNSQQSPDKDPGHE